MMQEILLITLLVVVLIFGFWAIRHTNYRSEEKKQPVSPIRLRAYERLTLLLERTKPEHMLMGLDLSSMTMHELQQHLLQTIRSEFEYNMSQQVYVSDEAWTMVINARDQMAAFVVGIASQLPQEADAMTYAKALLAAFSSNGTTPTDKALEALKNEAKEFM